MSLPPALAVLLANLQLSHPEALYLLPLAGVILIWALIRGHSLWRLGGPLLRAIILCLFVIALSDPHTVTRSVGATRPVVVDMSGSMSNPMRHWSAALLRDGLRLGDRDPAIVFGTAPVSTSAGDAIGALEKNQPCAGCDPDRTDLEAVLKRLADEPRAHGGDAVFITDGWENHGSAQRALSALSAARVRLEIFTPPGAGPVDDVAMTNLTVPPALAKASPFVLSVTLANLGARPAAGSITLYQDNRVLQTRPVVVSPGQQRYDFNIIPPKPGLLSYRAVFKPSDPAQDRYPENDSEQGWVGIGAQHKILILTDSARDAEYLAEVVRKTGYEPQVVVVANGEYNGPVKDYDAILLNNVPRSRLSPSVQSALISYVAGGGALAMIGGDQSFGLGGYENSALAAAMPVIMKPPQHRETQRALVLIIDKSGSMGRNDKLEYAKAAALTVTKTLNNNDLVAVIGFDSQPFVVVPLEPLSISRPYFAQMIDRLVAQGTTYLLPALQEADRMLATSTASVKHVVILTDGETGGSAVMYYDLVSSMHHDGNVTISTIAIGREANVPLLQAISHYGGGGFYQTDSPQNLPTIFLQDVKRRSGEVTMVEKDFLPRSVNPDPLLGSLASRQLPRLLGYVSTELKPKAALSMYVDRSGRREPLIASWRFGAGKTLAVTTDASGRWSGPWIRNGFFAPLWDKLLAWMAPPVKTTQEQFAAEFGYDNGYIIVRLIDYSEAPGHRTPEMLTALVTRPDGTRAETMLTENAPGELSGRINAPQPGTYGITLRALGAHQSLAPLAYTVSAAVLAELPRPTPNYALLESLSAATGGHLNPPIADIAMTRPTYEHRVSLGGYFVVAAMIVLIMEAFIRRLTW
jgi:Ca-activated chloride channel family protein